jgi:alkylated DNA nucleotide flippase Atl1
MIIKLTFEAETSAELDTQVREYVLGRERSGRPSDTMSMPAAPGDRNESKMPTNEDYRRAIRAIPEGKVAAYSVVSEAVRGDTKGSQKVAGLAANDANLDKAYRVVRKDGSVAAGFRWSDGRMGGPDDGRRALENEGIRFDVHGRVLPEYMLNSAELRRYYEKAR